MHVLGVLLTLSIGPSNNQIGRKNRDLSAQEVTATLAAVCGPGRTVEERVTVRLGMYLLRRTPLSAFGFGAASTGTGTSSPMVGTIFLRS